MQYYSPVSFRLTLATDLAVLSDAYEQRWTHPPDSNREKPERGISSGVKVHVWFFLQPTYTFWQSIFGEHALLLKKAF